MLNTATKIIKRILKHKISPEQRFLAYHYLRHNQRRLEHLASLQLDIAGSTVLEVGAGIGDHTSFFIDRGCKIVSTDAREENLQVLRSRYPDITVRRLDMNAPDQTFNEVFDIVYCYGLLYHLNNPSVAIERMSRWCRRLLLLETCVSYGDENAINPCTENAKSPTQSVSGQGCRPTRIYVYNQLHRYFEFVYFPITQPNHEQFPIDWTVVPATEDNTLTRAVFIASRQRLDNKFLTEEVPSLQKRAP